MWAVNLRRLRWLRRPTAPHVARYLIFERIALEVQQEPIPHSAPAQRNPLPVPPGFPIDPWGHVDGVPRQMAAVRRPAGSGRHIDGLLLRCSHAVRYRKVDRRESQRATRDTHEPPIDSDQVSLARPSKDPTHGAAPKNVADQENRKPSASKW